MPADGHRYTRLKFFSAIIFCAGITVGLHLAGLKPLWGDEIRSQKFAVNSLSYPQIFAGRFIASSEANVCPLFFVIQKFIGGLFHYKLTIPHDGVYIYDPRSQIVMRLAPNIFTSLTLAVMFYFFARYYSLGAGLYALGMTLAFYPVWVYWAEARPYAMWIFLTVVQSLVWMRLTAEREDRGKFLKWAAVVQYLLVLTVFLGALQVLIFGAMLLIFKIVSIRQWQKIFWLCGLPVLISLYYYCFGSHFAYSLTSGLDLLVPSFPLAWAAFCAVFLVLGPGRGRQSAAVLTYIGLSVVSALVLLFLFKIVSVPGAPNVVFARHFLYLAGAALTSTVFLALHLRLRFKGNTWMTFNVLVMMAGVLIVTSLNTFAQVTVLEIYNPP